MAEQSTEFTPLLAATAQNDVETLPVPEIRLTLEHIQGLDPQDLEFSHLCPHSLPTHASRTAFALIVLLQWRLNRLRPTILTRDVWERWTGEQDDARLVEDLEQRIAGLWSEFLGDYRSLQEIEDVLWSAYLDREASHRTVRVVDFVGDIDAPVALLSHRLVYLSLLRSWKRGFSVPGQPGNPMRPRNVTRFDLICTPRVLHFIELFFHMGYLATLVIFVLFPPRRAIITGTFADSDWRGLFSMAFAVSSLARSWSISSVPFLLVFVSFSSCLPSVPVAGDVTFSFLMVAIALHTLQLHLPSGPTPIFLLPFELCLPLCALLSRCMAQIIFPVLLLFLPIMLLTWSLLSFSLRDTFFFVTSLPSPIETRIGLLSIFAAEIVLLIPSLLTPLTLAASLSRNDRSVTSWDRYSRQVGFEARKSFVRAVLAYSTPHTFPPPFNLIPLLFQFLSATLRVHGAPSSVLAYMERLLWRITVGPVAVVVSLLWFWGG